MLYNWIDVTSEMLFFFRPAVTARYMSFGGNKEQKSVVGFFVWKLMIYQVV